MGLVGAEIVLRFLGGQPSLFDLSRGQLDEGVVELGGPRQLGGLAHLRLGERAGAPVDLVLEEVAQVRVVPLLRLVLEEAADLGAGTEHLALLWVLHRQLLEQGSELVVKGGRAVFEFNG